MLDDDPEVHRLFSRIGQVVVFHRHLHQSLHDSCTAIFASQGFDSLFAQAMMDDQETPVILKTWRNLVKDELQDTDPESLRPLLLLWQRLAQVIAAMEEVAGLRWIADAPAPKGCPTYEALAEPTLQGSNLPLERVILDAANLCSALTVVSKGWATDRGCALLETAWAVAEGK